MSLRKIISDGLEQNGFDGLVCPGICGCLRDDLYPGDCLTDECEPGYKHTHSQTGEWVISLKKDGLTDDDIQECIDECC